MNITFTVINAKAFSPHIIYAHNLLKVEHLNFIGESYYWQRILNDADIHILNMLTLVRECLSHFLNKCCIFTAN